MERASFRSERREKGKKDLACVCSFVKITEIG